LDGIFDEDNVGLTEGDELISIKLGGFVGNSVGAMVEIKVGKYVDSTFGLIEGLSEGDMLG